MDFGYAIRSLASLPSWCVWHLATAGTTDGQDADIVCLPQLSHHPNLPTRGEYNDLRSEQKPPVRLRPRHADPPYPFHRSSRPDSGPPLPPPQRQGTPR